MKSLQLRVQFHLAVELLFPPHLRLQHGDLFLQPRPCSVAGDVRGDREIVAPSRLRLADGTEAVPPDWGRLRGRMNVPHKVLVNLVERQAGKREAQRLARYPVRMVVAAHLEGVFACGGRFLVADPRLDAIRKRQDKKEMVGYQAIHLPQDVLVQFAVREFDLEDFDLRDSRALGEIQRVRRELVAPPDRLDLVDERTLQRGGDGETPVELLLRHAAIERRGFWQVEIQISHPPLTVRSSFIIIPTTCFLGQTFASATRTGISRPAFGCRTGIIASRGST